MTPVLDLGAPSVLTDMRPLYIHVCFLRKAGRFFEVDGQSDYGQDKYSRQEQLAVIPTCASMTPTDLGTEAESSGL